MADELIVVRVLKSFGMYYANDTAGFPAAVVASLVKSGHAQRLEPEAAEGEAASVDPDQTIDPSAPPAPPADAPPADPAAAADNALTEPTAEPAEGETLESIPEDWQTLHGNTRKKYAKLISGAPVGSLDEADAIIAAEVQRRAAAP